MILSSFILLLVFSTFNFYQSNLNIIILNRLGILSLCFSLIILLNSLSIIPLIPGFTIFNDLFLINSYNTPILFIILLISIILLFYKSNINQYNLKTPYFLLLVLINIIGLLLLPLINNLIALYIVIELQSFSLYLITGIHNRSYNSTRAALLYFLIGAIASSLILLFSYLIYSLTGSLSISDIHIFMINCNMNTPYIWFDGLLIALFLKMGLVPLHRWSISVYNYAPTYITAYISIVAKLSIIGFIYSHYYLFDNIIIFIFFYLSLIIGSINPLFQVNIKIILAYSGILNFGYILLSLITFDISFYIYLYQYILTHCILFISILIISPHISKSESIWSPIIFIHQLIMPNKALAYCMVIALFSLIGLPPLSGFYGKYLILQAAILDNYIFEVILLVFVSVIATYYYANIIKILIKSKDNLMYNINSTMAYIISTSTILLITLFVYLPNILEGLYILTI